MELSDKQKLQKLREMAVAIDETPEDADIEHEDLIDIVDKILDFTGGN